MKPHLHTSIHVPKLYLPVLMCANNDRHYGVDNDGIDSTRIPVFERRNRLIGSGIDIKHGDGAIRERDHNQGSRSRSERIAILVAGHTGDTRRL